MLLFQLNVNTNDSHLTFLIDMSHGPSDRSVVVARRVKEVGGRAGRCETVRKNGKKETVFKNN